MIESISALKSFLHERGIASQLVNDELRVESPASEGFSISICGAEPDLMVSYDDGWHEHFSSFKEAVPCFLFGLTSNCRLITWIRGKMHYCWKLQAQEDGEWVTYDTTCLLIFPIWRRKRTIILQNDLISEQAFKSAIAEE